MEFGQNELKLVSDCNSSLYFQVNQSRVYRPSLVEKPVKSSQFRREPITVYMSKTAINREAVIEVPSKVLPVLKSCHFVAVLGHPTAANQFACLTRLETVLNYKFFSNESKQNSTPHVGNA